MKTGGNTYALIFIHIVVLILYFYALFGATSPVNVDLHRDVFNKMNGMTHWCVENIDSVVNSVPQWSIRSLFKI